MKSIYNEDDASCNEVGNDIKFEGEKFFKEILEKYPEYNPREMVELLSGTFGMQSCRRILQMRKEGIHLKGYK